MLSFFNAEQSSPWGCPASAMDIVISSFLFAFFGIMMYIGSVRFELTYDKPAKWWRWSFAPLGVAVLLGIQKCVFLTSLFYANTVVSKKLLYSHYLSLLVPVLCVAAIFLHKWLKQRTEQRRVY